MPDRRQFAENFEAGNTEEFWDYDPEAELARFYETYLPEIRLRGTFFLKLER